MGRVEGKVALVTGAASGIGRATAQMLVAEGARVMLTDVQDELGAQVAAAIGSNARYRHHDVTSEDAWIATVAATVEAFGGLDILVNNAGIGIGVPDITKMSLADFQRQQAVNVDGVVNGINAFMPLLLEQNEGHVISTASLAGLGGLVVAGCDSLTSNRSVQKVIESAEGLTRRSQRQRQHRRRAQPGPHSTCRRR
jgi:NAD(P)-dependent dehydrogenase (short-subunit alcohol dehydrogenase family)